MPRTRKLAAIMFTDIQGYTALMQQSEARAVELRDKHRQVFEAITQQYKGQIINYYGDGTLSIFDSAIEAINCGYELQLLFLEEPKIPVRIGIHMGDIIVTDDDIIGDSVNIASRIEALATAGSVLFSEKVKAEIRNQDHLHWKEIGSFRFKNDGRDRIIFALDMPGLNLPEQNSLQRTSKPPIDLEEKKASDRKKNVGFTPRTVKVVLGIVLLAVLVVVGYQLINYQERKEWALQEAIPQIEQLRDEKKFKDAHDLAMQAARYLKNDSGLEALWLSISWKPNVESDPPGAKVYRKSYDRDNQNWVFIGTTPINNIRTYIGPSIWKFEKEGFEPAIRLVPSQTVQLDRLGSIPNGMVRVESGITDLSMIMGFDLEYTSQKINSFLIDEYEVTNQAFKEFVDDGGYLDKTYWIIPFKRNNQVLSFEKAIKLFTDKTGRPGPAGWELGEYPKDQDRYPVTGISWFEAAAYAAYKGKSLPTLYHWDLAANIRISNLVIPASNIQRESLAQVGSFPGITSSGVYDLAGNVKEWLWNGSKLNQGRTVIGGAWNDPTHTFNEAGSMDPFSRSATVGFRCIRYLEPNGNQETLERNANEEIELFSLGSPVSDETFQSYLRQYTFDKTPLNHTIELIPMEQTDRKCEKIEFDAAYSNERMSAYLYMPTHVDPPYQTVVYFTGTAAMWTPQFDPNRNYQTQFIDFILKSGRAFLFPVLKSTYDRQDGLPNSNPSPSVNYKDHVIMWVKDIIRSVDYLETRTDIQMDNLGYYGLSWGARIGPVCLAVEPRLKAAVLVSGGISIYAPLEEVAEYTYLPRVKIPVLMLNGLHDYCCFPVEAAQKPFYNLLGTDAKHKRHVLFENAGHLPARADLINETFDWYDQYLGKVQ